MAPTPRVKLEIFFKSDALLDWSVAWNNFCQLGQQRFLNESTPHIQAALENETTVNGLKISCAARKVMSGFTCILI